MIKQFVFLCFSLCLFSISAQQTVFFRLSNEQDASVKNTPVFRKNLSLPIDTTDLSGVMRISSLCSGDTLHLSVAKCAGFQYIVPDPIPTQLVQLQSKCTFSAMDLPAEYPGGKAAMNQFFKENFQYPQAAIEHGITGKVWVRFVIDADGTVTDVKITRPMVDCPECNDEAVRLIKLMPKWIPGTVNDKPVKSYWDMPVTFMMY